ncbi:MAG: glycosyltransferase family 2 protein, partial [Chloroflexi bacterium]|nr:glycosyltransferase family 2 protein [Chloroflexota bacterium]
MKLLSIVTGCYNEEENVRELYEQVKQVVERLPGYTYEHIFIDNASRDQTVAVLREIAQNDPRVKVIVNTRNFGHVRSACHALLQAKGDAAIAIVADLQDPPRLIADFVHKWEEGYKVVLGVKKRSEEARGMFWIRKMYYDVLRALSDVELVQQFTGFGLYDRVVIDILREMDDPYPYFRGMIAEIGFESARIEYTQPKRQRGITKNNFYTLYDMAMLGMTSYSKVPLRLATITGFMIGVGSLLVALIYLVYKL